jgi:hypothetical protein
MISFVNIKEGENFPNSRIAIGKVIESTGNIG